MNNDNTNDEIVILTHPDCTGCKAIKEIVEKDENLKKQCSIVDISSDEGFELFKDLDVTYVPYAVIVKKQKNKNGVIEITKDSVCDISPSENNKGISLDCKKV